MAAILFAIVFLNVFWPTFALHVLGGPLFAAVFVVILLWAVVAFALIYRPMLGMGTNIGNAWSAWLASRKAAPPAAEPKDPPAEERGGQEP